MERVVPSRHISDAPKPHVCPPSNAAHPSDRWETLFIYSFICKFTNLREKVDGLESPMDLEEALMSREPNEILSQVLQQFILNLKPQTRNLSTDQISTTVAAVLSDHLKASERTIFWNEDAKMNVDPFEGYEGGFFSADWDFKLKILRQLVELQLSHGVDIKAMIDRAWGVSHNKHKKKDPTSAPPDPSEPKSQEKLQLLPIGQDSQRKRYWVADDSPRVFISTNPWKITATFQTASSTKEEYLALIEELKASAPPPLKKGQKRNKFEHAHIALIATLDSRIEAIDAEIARVARVRKRIEQREHRKLLLAQTEVRETRTRRQTHRPDYVYSNTFDSEDDADEYTYQEEDVQDEEFEDDDFLNFRDELHNTRPRRSGANQGERRRSARTSTKLNANGKRESSSESWSHWRGERRSSRLGGPDSQPFTEHPPKRARTEDSMMSTNSAEAAPSAVNGTHSTNLKLKTSGAAALKPNEIALEQIAGKKKSKFWVYAVEPILGAEPSGLENTSNGDKSGSNNGSDRGCTNGQNGTHRDSPPASPHENGMNIDQMPESRQLPLTS